MLKKKIRFEDPETQKIIQGRVHDALLWRLILNGTQGETTAIKEIIDRIDGKMPDTVIDQSTHVVMFEALITKTETIPDRIKEYARTNQADESADNQQAA